jgi:hypothetical protein
MPAAVERAIRAEMDRLGGELVRLIHRAPDDFAAIEPLFMAREDLRAALHRG